MVGMCVKNPLHSTAALRAAPLQACVCVCLCFEEEPFYF